MGKIVMCKGLGVMAEPDQTVHLAERRQRSRRTSMSGLHRRVKLLVGIATAIAAAIVATSSLAVTWQTEVFSLISMLLLGSMLIVLVGGIVHVWRLAQQHFSELQYALEQLREARQSAEAASQAKSRFLTTVSHELRTPLNGVLGMTGLLLETSLSAEQRSYAGAVDSSARSLLSIIDELLDVAQADAGKLTISPGEVNLHDDVESIIELLAPRAHAKGIEVSCFVSPDLPAQVKGDTKRLGQVLLNVVGNAIKFTTQGGVLVTVKPGTGEDEVIFEVRDSGHGIPAEELETIFGRFVQSSVAQSQAAGGTGLGLAISRDIVRLMGGDISIESELGKGSVFRFGIAMEPVTKQSAASAPAGPGLEDKTVHLCMPKGANREAVSMYLECHGARVLNDHDLQGLETRMKEPDVTRSVILVDASVCNSPSALLDLTTRLSREHSVWVLLKPEERREHRKLMEGGNIGYLVKPVRYATLRQQLGISDAGKPGHVGALRQAATRLRGGKVLRVMLVEDNQINRMLAEKILQSAGHHVRHFPTGEEAVAEVEANLAETGHAGFDVILMDILMPGMDGLEATRRIRALENKAGTNQPVPVLALSANARRDDQKASLAAGMNGYVAKPFDRADLELAIHRLALARAA
jgi:signal transduction histidine kinase/CheY-like chemotaxis protein